jgi:hypothetical protein
MIIYQTSIQIPNIRVILLAELAIRRTNQLWRGLHKRSFGIFLFRLDYKLTKKSYVKLVRAKIRKKYKKDLHTYQSRAESI